MKIQRCMLDIISALDVECDFRVRKGSRHFVKVNMPQAGNERLEDKAMSYLVQRIESKVAYQEKILLRSVDEREIKAELLLKSFFDCIDEKLRVMNRGGKRSIQRFSETMMQLVCEKVLSV